MHARILSNDLQRQQPKRRRMHEPMLALAGRPVPRRLLLLGSDNCGERANSAQPTQRWPIVTSSPRPVERPLQNEGHQAVEGCRG